jgi:hypothetical protein
VIFPADTERRASLVAAAGAVLVFVLLLILLPAFYRSFDESKYLGIGYNMLAGNGPKTIFGATFLPHSPLWPMIMVAPDVWFGIDPFDWGHLLNGVAAFALLATVLALGWRIRPVVGALAVVGYVAVPYLHDLTRTARLDVPAAALALAYVYAGLDAVRRGSIRRGVLAGLVFAIAFLIKEIALPFAPVPFLVGILAGRPLASIARVGAATLAVAAIGTWWWFAMFAGYASRVYRLGTPAWTLGPIYLLIALAVLAGLAAPWLADRFRARGLAASVRQRIPARFRERGRAITAWVLAFAWFLALVVFFDRNPELKGNGIVQPNQYLLYAATWLPHLALKVGALVGIVGIVLSLGARRSVADERREQFDALYLTLLCSLPLVLLVVAVGEPPRNYLAQLGVAIVLSAAGWVWLAGLLLPRVSSARGAGVVVVMVAGVAAFLARVVVVPTAIGLLAGAALGIVVARRLLGANRATSPQAPRELTSGMTLSLLGMTLAVSTLLLSSYALGHRASATSSVQVSAVDDAAKWIETNVPPGTKIGFGSFLGYTTAIEVGVGYPMVQIHQTLAAVDPDAPLGLRDPGDGAVDDWIAIEVSRREKEFYAFRASVFAEAITRRGVQVYVYHTGPTTSVPALLGALTPEHGFTELASWSYPGADGTVGPTTLATHIYRVDPDRVGFEGSPVYVTQGAANRLVNVLERESVTASTAQKLAEHLALWPTGTRADDLLARLEALAGR